MSPKPAHEPRRRRAAPDWTDRPCRLPCRAGSFSTHVTSSWPLLFVDRRQVHRADHGEDVGAGRIHHHDLARAQRAAHAGEELAVAVRRRAVDRRHHHLDLLLLVASAAAGAEPGTFAAGHGRCGVGWRLLAARSTPAATWPGERASKVGGLPISVATRGAACWAMRDTSRSLASAIVLRSARASGWSRGPATSALAVA